MQVFGQNLDMAVLVSRARAAILDTVQVQLLPLKALLPALSTCIRKYRRGSGSGGCGLGWLASSLNSGC